MVSEIRQGDLYWLDLGPAPRSAKRSAPAERHPCLVVQGDRFNRSRIHTTVVCLITSNLSRASAPGNVLLEKGEGNLPKPSVVNVSQVQTVDKSDLVHRIGRLGAGKVEQVLEGLALLFAPSANHGMI